MPNWADNQVTIKGDKAILKEILDKAQWGGVEWSFNNLVPMPAKFSAEEQGDSSPFTEEAINAMLGSRKFDYTNPYDWAVANWGTKWDVTNSSQVLFGLGEDGKENITVTYSSAWSPATNFWKTVSELYPSVTIEQRYHEEGMGYIGESFIQAGKVDDYCIDITKEMYAKAGAVLNAEWEIDWDASDSLDFSLLYPLTRL